MSKIKKKAKIVIFANFSYLGGDPFVLLRLTKGLAQKGFVITFVGPVGKSIYPFLRSLPWIQNVIPLVKDIESISKKVEKEAPDLLINSSPSIITAKIAFERNEPIYTRIVGHPKWWIDPMGGPEKKVRRVVRSIGILSDRVITVSNFLKPLFISEGFNNVDTIYEGCNTNEFLPVKRERLEFRKEFGLSKKETAFGVIAHFTWQKRHDLVIRALSLYQKKNPYFKCFFVGGSCGQGMQNRENELKKLVRKYNLQRHIIFTGFRNDIRRVINGLDIPIFPFVEEAFGMAVVESMACEKPVILNRSGSFIELIENSEEGLFVDAENPNTISKALLELTENPKLSKAMGKKGRFRIKCKFSFQRHLDAHLKLIKQLIKWN